MTVPDGTELFAGEKADESIRNSDTRIIFILSDKSRARYIKCRNPFIVAVRKGTGFVFYKSRADPENGEITQSN